MNSDQMTPSRGLLHMILSCVFFAVMANLAYLAQIVEPAISTLSLSSSRIFINLAGMIVLAFLTLGSDKPPNPEGFPRTHPDSGRRWWSELWGKGELSLWLRGVFGAIAMILSFAALRAVGAGESTFLQSSNSLFVAALAPVVLGQKNTSMVWVALLGSALGLFFLLEPRVTDTDPLGRLYGIGSGLFSAAAYLMIAKAGSRNRPETVVFYFCLVGSFIHLILLLLFPTQWPTRPLTWLILLGVGLFGTLAQMFLTTAYQGAPAALAGAVAYTQPVLNTLAGTVFFGHSLDFQTWVGASLVAGFGVVIPFLISRTASRKPSVEGPSVPPPPAPKD